MVFSRESSPDPLIRSYMGGSLLLGTSPLKDSAEIHAKGRSGVLRESSPNVRRSHSPSKQQQTLIFSTPTRRSGVNKGTTSSPIKIRVTVEADTEPEVVSTPKSRRKSGSRTVMVPLKGETEQKTTRTRRQTPKSSAKQSTGSKSDTDGVDRDFMSPTSTPISQSDIMESIERDIPATGEYGWGQDQAREGRQTPEQDVPIRSLGNSFANMTPLHKKPENAALLHKPAEVYTPFETRVAQIGTDSGAKRIRERVPTPAKLPKRDQPIKSPLPTSKPEKNASSGMRGGFASQLDESFYDREGQAESGGFSYEETVELDRSLAESEEFSMVSIDSLRNHREQAERAANPRAAVGPAQKVSNIEAQSSRITKERPESHELLSRSESTSIPKQIICEEIPDAAAPLERTRKRRLTDQDPFAAFGPGTKRHLSASLAMGELLARNEPDFSNLAKAGHIGGNSEPLNDASRSPRRHTRLPTPSDTAESNSSSSPVPNEALPGRKDYDEMSWEPTLATHASQEATSVHDSVVDEHSHSPASRSTTIPTVNSMRQSQDQRQREHEEGIRQAQDAEKSKIIRTSPGHLVEEWRENEKPPVNEPTMTSSADIWLEEANSSVESSMISQNSRPNRKPAQKAKEPTLDLRELLGEDNRPTRGKIPRTWRRTSGHHFLYSDENPSPMRPSSKPLFEQDLEAYLSRSEGEDDISDKVQQIGREISPMKSILCSPERKQEPRSPKEVRFGNDETHQFDFIAQDDSQYYSSDDSDDGDTDVAEETVYANNEEPANQGKDADSSDIRQLRREIAAVTPARSVPFIRISEKEEGSSIFSGWSPSIYVSVTRNTNGEPAAKPVGETNILTNHIKPTLGVFARLSSWLFPPKQVFNRNHFLLLDFHWKTAFPSPESVLEAALLNCRSSSQSKDSWSCARDMADISPDLQKLVGTIVDSCDHEGNATPPMQVTIEQCSVAHAFMLEAKGRGIPLICDGSLDRASKSDEYPKRDKSGRIVRVKETWFAQDVITSVYGLWARDVLEALEATGTEWPEDAW